MPRGKYLEEIHTCMQKTNPHLLSRVALHSSVYWPDWLTRTQQTHKAGTFVSREASCPHSLFLMSDGAGASHLVSRWLNQTSIQSSYECALVWALALFYYSSTVRKPTGLFYALHQRLELLDHMIVVFFRFNVENILFPPSFILILMHSNSEKSAAGDVAV